MSNNCTGQAAGVTHISVIICTYNRAESLRRTLTSLTKQKLDHDAFEIIVVDNNSSDHTSQVVTEFSESTRLDVHYVREERRGKPFALNTGIDRAHSQLIAFTDDDVVVDPNWLTALRRAFTSGADMVSGRVIPDWEAPPPCWLAERAAKKEVAGIMWSMKDVTPCPTTVIAAGANMAARRSVLLRHGGFNTALAYVGRGSVGGEDWELYRRLVQEGCQSRFEPTAVVHHRVEASQMTRNYFRHWWFNQGMSESIRSLESRPKWFQPAGIPLWRMQAACMAGLSAVRAFLEPAADFFAAEMQLWCRLGFIWHRLTERRRTAPSLNTGDES
jgi:glycosyltransferase involved in cell wall biosynthesis